MSRAVISIENLSKQYRLGSFGLTTFGDDLRRVLSKGDSEDDARILHALRELNIEVREGEILGVVGKNGAGKSTLLKLLSRITAPTAGRIRIKGRIASLLEVGTGMHPELSGRENIFLNGAILGMSREEIRKKFDDIAGFSECGRFIDTPIKRYSSGMKVRLGFAVAAFLDAEILIVDEVLAVGDAEFQKRALGKMREITSTSRRTVLLVSHNMRSITSLCTRAILLESGRLAAEGDPRDVVSAYLGAGVAGRDRFEFSAGGARVSGRIESGEGGLFEDRGFRMVFSLSGEVANPGITLNFKNGEGEVILTSFHREKPVSGQSPREWTCEVPGGFFNSGKFHVDVLLVSDGTRLIHRESNALAFEVHEGKREVGSYQGRIQGYVVAPFRWETR
ncbi:MAG TPA: ABC transporter ATP-binding protein [Cryomorphaceae bacterium]|nr:ABC transporter ATP-binding protein [Cryomorphaceae bacterium]